MPATPHDVSPTSGWDILDRIRELGILDDTLLIFTSDHGHQLAEHGIIGKLPQDSTMS
jgi:arylsulfatase A-like enzyme